MELKLITSYKIEEHSSKRIAIYGDGFHTSTLICEITNPFFSIEEKRELAKKILAGLEKK